MMNDEMYRLTFLHYFIDEDGRHMVEEPLSVEMCIDRRFPQPPICINNMLDMMRHELLKRVGSEADTRGLSR